MNSESPLERPFSFFITQLEHVDHVKVDDVEDLRVLVVGDCAVERPGRVDAHVLDVAEVRAEVLHELDADLKTGKMRQGRN